MSMAHNPRVSRVNVMLLICRPTFTKLVNENKDIYRLSGNTNYKAQISAKSFQLSLSVHLFNVSVSYVREPFIHLMTA